MVVEITFLTIELHFKLFVAISSHDMLNTAGNDKPDIEFILQFLVRVQIKDLLFDHSSGQTIFKSADRLGVKDIRDSRSDDQATFEGSLVLINE